MKRQGTPSFSQTVVFTFLRKKIVWIKSTEALFHRFVAFMFTASVSDEMQTSKKLARKIHWMLGFDLKKKTNFHQLWETQRAFASLNVTLIILNIFGFELWGKSQIYFYTEINCDILRFYSEKKNPTSSIAWIIRDKTKNGWKSTW